MADAAWVFPFLSSGDYNHKVYLIKQEYILSWYMPELLV